MGDDYEEMLNVTMKRLEVIMQDTKLALENRADKLINAAISILVHNPCSQTAESSWRILLRYAKELYIETLVYIPVPGDKNQYLLSAGIMEEILVCKNNLSAF